MRHSLPTLILCAAQAFALDVSTLKPQGYVSDFAGVIDPASRVQLNWYGGRVQQLTGAQIAIVTLGSLEGEIIEDVANKLYRTWGVGAKGANEGVLLLFAVNDRRMRMEVGYGLEGIFPDGYSGQLLDHMRPLLRERHYGAALVEATQEMGAAIAKSKNVSLDARIPPARVKKARAPMFPALLVPFGFIILLLWLFGRARRRYGSSYGSGPSFFPGMGGGWGGGGGHGGGGFGGYDSSDSFGGFGGGDSGGGGSSSDW
ncbi:MAG: TPM domain-containing protein [Candidatus Solibacter usitatus]|nr:TPM domain-containing protein [Candidatus Solibacter usitatus]